MQLILEKNNIYLTVAGLPHYSAGNMHIENDGEIKSELQSLEDFKCGTRFISCKHGHKYITMDYTFDVDDNGEVINLEKCHSPTRKN